MDTVESVTDYHKLMAVCEKMKARITVLEAENADLVSYTGKVKEEMFSAQRRVAEIEAENAKLKAALKSRDETSSDLSEEQSP